MPKNLTNVKEDILAVTRQMIKETGYSELNIRNIAARCGVATGTVYNYYSSKNQIIAEILLNEWNLMLRRVDQSTRHSAPRIDKLKIIYDELNNFMINVHGKWFQTHPVENTEEMNVSKLNEKRKLLRNQISEKVLALVQPAAEKKQHSREAVDISDIIAHVLISYSNEEAEFSRLKPALAALLEQLADASI
ncbi:putative HTH-type transcriptional regulator YvdT [Ruminiclostridium hungatei]|uniref:Putative HTH-type transcriptional regulator YvdT n=1 Tax=Ruminiclostridium hungatei TaxID=48256 RepID=A0A1V4SJR7_RUMHU|nr:TetR/AcrR family transcriptional regulator [Ruminiclostridium hungatei]OPX44023.1 putative HTH-type transcriptional regulator YvdT [Ruminiclostridium hungatei]